MGGPNPDTIRSHRTLLEQLATLAETDTESSDYGINSSTFVESLNKLHPTHTAYGKQAFTRKRPTSRAFTTFIFGRLGIETDSVPFQDVLEALTADFNEQMHGLSLAEQQARVSPIPADSKLRKAYVALDSAVSDFHGNLYDGEMHHAQILGCFVVMSARNAATAMGDPTVTDLLEAS